MFFSSCYLSCGGLGVHQGDARPPNLVQVMFVKLLLGSWLRIQVQNPQASTVSINQNPSSCFCSLWVSFPRFAGACEPTPFSLPLAALAAWPPFQGSLGFHVCSQRAS